MYTKWPASECFWCYVCSADCADFDRILKAGELTFSPACASIPFSHRFFHHIPFPILKPSTFSSLSLPLPLLNLLLLPYPFSTLSFPSPLPYPPQKPQ